MAPSDPDLIPHHDPAGGPRVRTLLASVRDLTASLHRLTTQLERELCALPAVGPADGFPGPAPLPGEEPASARAQLDLLRTELEQLRAAQEHRRVIEQAKGMLMAGRRCSEQQAFDLLVGMSQAEQRKVRDIAAEIVTAAVNRPAPDRSGAGTSPAEPTPEGAGTPPRPRTADPVQSPDRTPAQAPVRPRRIDLDLADTPLPVGRQPRSR